MRRRARHDSYNSSSVFFSCALDSRFLWLERVGCFARPSGAMCFDWLPARLAAFWLAAVLVTTPGAAVARLLVLSSCFGRRRQQSKKGQMYLRTKKTCLFSLRGQVRGTNGACAYERREGRVFFTSMQQLGAHVNSPRCDSSVTSSCFFLFFVLAGTLWTLDSFQGF